MAIVIIIGNGFDLNLGLNTGYGSFIKSHNFNEIADAGNNLAKYLRSKHNLQNWIDIENELKIYSKEIFKEDDRSVFKSEYIELCRVLCRYINSIDYSDINKESYAYNVITNAYNKNIDITIYNFNYTNSIHQMVESEGWDISKVNIVDMHGNASSEKIIFGVEDGANINKRDTFLLKSASKYFNCDVNLENIIKDAKNIVIIGHSLGETDHFYVKPFFQDTIYKRSANKTIVITYHTESGYDDIMMQLASLTTNDIAKFRQNNNVKFKEI